MPPLIDNLEYYKTNVKDKLTKDRPSNSTFAERIKNDSLNRAKYYTSTAGLKFIASEALLQTTNSDVRRKLLNAPGLIAQDIYQLKDGMFHRDLFISQDDSYSNKKFLEIYEKTIMSINYALESLPETELSKYSNLEWYYRNAKSLFNSIINKSKKWVYDEFFNRKKNTDSVVFELDESFGSIGISDPKIQSIDEEITDRKNKSFFVNHDLIKEYQHLNDNIKYKIDGDLVAVNDLYKATFDYLIKDKEEKNNSQFIKFINPKTNEYIEYLENLHGVMNKNDYDEETDKNIIKFLIEIINDNTLLLFDMTIESIDENINGGWNSVKPIGRADSIHHYQSVERSINFSVKVMAKSEKELKPMYQKINKLIGTLYPFYNENNLMESPLVKLTIGNIFNETVGYFTSLTLNYQSILWETIKNYKDKDLAQLPKEVSLAFAFTPIGNKLLHGRSNQLIFGLPKGW